MQSHRWGCSSEDDGAPPSDPEPVAVAVRRLAMNYRSAGGILRAASALIAHNRGSERRAEQRAVAGEGAAPNGVDRAMGGALHCTGDKVMI